MQFFEIIKHLDVVEDLGSNMHRLGTLGCKYIRYSLIINVKYEPIYIIYLTKDNLHDTDPNP